MIIGEIHAFSVIKEVKGSEAFPFVIAGEIFEDDCALIARKINTQHLRPLCARLFVYKKTNLFCAVHYSCNGAKSRL